MVLIGRMGLAAIRAQGWKPRVVGGLTMGADPVAYAIAAASQGTDWQVDAFSVRKEPKAHGTGQQIEGNFRAGDSAAIVEDVITTGGSARKAIAAVKDAGGSVVGVVAVVDREEGGRGELERSGLRVVSLTTASKLDLK